MAVQGDNPIHSVEDDLLGRQAIAESLAREIRSADTSEGYVLGVVGPWGSGKTSLLNLMTVELDLAPKLTVIKFNPWMFTGTEQLIEAFFHELASQLKESNSSRFKTISSTIDKYAELFSPITLIPVVGAWYERAQKIVKATKKFGDSNNPSVSARKAELARLLKDLDEPIVVTIDDIDRLNSDEIRSLFKLVRLTGNFPNVIYVLAFDRRRVESALTEDGIEGRAYLEKIVQHGFQIPEVPQHQLLIQLGEALNGALGDIDPKHFDESRWQDLIAEVVLPLLRNMRDVRRYSAAAASTARDLADEVDLGDILAMEAVRVFRPDRFDLLVAARRGLTTPISGRDDPDLKRLVEDTLGKDDEQTNDVVRALIERVFPLGVHYIGGTNYADGFTQTWLRARRMANAGILSLYLERVMPKELREFIEAERLYHLLQDRGQLEQHMRSLDPALYNGVISSLEAFEDDFPEAAVVPASSLFLNLIPEIPRVEKRGMFDFGDPELRVTRVVLRLLRRLADEASVLAAVEEILQNLKTLSAKFSLVSLVGHREGIGHKFVTEASARRLEDALVAEISAADYAALANEWDLLRLLSTPEYWGLRSGPFLTNFSTPAVHEAVLRQARGEIISQGMGSRAIGRRYTLHWETLLRVYGDEDAIKKAVSVVKAKRGKKDDELKMAVELTEKYLSGWRPERL